MRGLLLKLNTVSCGRRSLAHYVPLRMNVEFHKMLALVVGSLAFMHVWAHFMNFAEAPKVSCDDRTAPLATRTTCAIGD